MRVLALCDSLAQARRFHHEVGTLEGAQLEFLVCNHSGRAGWLFLLVQLRRVLKAGSAGLRLLLSGRVRISPRPLHHPGVLSRLQRGGFDIGLHGMGVIYRREAIDAFRLGILNAHIGRLPAYRGRSVMEWSLLHGAATGVSTFFIDTGIDTGTPIVCWEAIDVRGMDSIATAKQHLFEQDTRQYRAALQTLLQEPRAGEPNLTEQGHRYYVMSGLFNGVVEQRLRAGGSR